MRPGMLLNKERKQNTHTNGEIVEKYERNRILC